MFDTGDESVSLVGCPLLECGENSFRLSISTSGLRRPRETSADSASMHSIW